VALVVGALLWGNENQTMITVNGNHALWVFMLGGAVLVITGVLDDRFHLGVAMRVLSEVAAALILIEGLDLRVVDLGNLVGLGPIHMTPAIAYPFTVIAVFGIINAFNMLDGMDGLLASLVLVTLFTFHMFTETTPGFVSLFIGASLLAFLCSNLKLFPFIPKTFLGDAGSKLLGFIMVSLILAATAQQIGGTKLIQPVTALFIVGLPLYDMVFTTLRRTLRGLNPLGADRSHIHHLLKALGFSDRRALAIILAVGLSIPMAGLMLHRTGAAETHQLAIFVGGFALYAFLTAQAWRVARLIESHQPQVSVSFSTDVGGSDGIDHAAESSKVARLHS
jgi:UDP-GlcNAc:undecaprenyl-phosphate GlcNAc-1-phosphate transferase